MNTEINQFEHMEESGILAHADRLVEAIKDSRKEKGTFEQLAESRIDEIKRQLEYKTTKIDEWIEGMEFELLQIANISKTKETKTQRKLELLAGDVIIKKATSKLKNDNKVILEAIKESRPDLVKEKITQSLDWATYKKELEIVGGDEIVNKVTGEVVVIEGLEIEQVPEIVQVK